MRGTACVLRSAPLVPMGRARESRPVSTRPRRPCPPSFPLQSPISKGQWYKLLPDFECVQRKLDFQAVEQATVYQRSEDHSPSAPSQVSGRAPCPLRHEARWNPRWLFGILGLDTDIGSEFLNWHRLNYFTNAGNWSDSPALSKRSTP